MTKSRNVANFVVTGGNAAIPPSDDKVGIMTTINFHPRANQH